MVATLARITQNAEPRGESRATDRGKPRAALLGGGARPVNLVTGPLMQ